MTSNQGLHLLNFVLLHCLLIVLGVWEHPDWRIGLTIVAMQLVALVALWRNL